MSIYGSCHSWLKVLPSLCYLWGNHTYETPYTTAEFEKYETDLAATARTLYS